MRAVYRRINYQRAHLVGQLTLAMRRRELITRLHVKQPRGLSIFLQQLKQWGVIAHFSVDQRSVITLCLRYFNSDPAVRIHLALHRSNVSLTVQQLYAIQQYSPGLKLVLATQRG